MESYYRPTRVEISLDALRHNLLAFRQLLPQQIRIMAVVKADAYGHGAVQVAKEAEACKADYLAVAFLDEAVQLREAGIRMPILVLGYTPPEAVATAIRLGVTMTVFSDEVLEAIARHADDRRPVNIHVKVDTGMGRLGLPTEEEAVRFIERAMAIRGIYVEGIFTHYANADERDKGYTYEQYRRFQRIIDHFKHRRIEFPFVHAGNSAAAIDSPELACNMVRLGIGLYGLYPSAEVNHRRIRLEPVLSWKTGVIMRKQLPPGSGISYGTVYRTTGYEEIATLPVGYADGFSRRLSGQAEVLIRGRKVPIVGRICMDQCMANVTSVPGANVGDEVVLIGRQENEQMTADDLARLLGTINYEVTCMISHRVPRVYLRGGEVVHVVNPLANR